jgi:hypothetical protein
VLQLHLVRDVLASGEKRYLGIVNYMDLVYVSSAGVKARPRCEALRERGLALAAELEDETLLGWVEGASGIASYLHGEYLLAREQLVASIEILRDRGVGARWQLDIVQIFLTATLWQLGDTAELVRVVELFLRDAVDRGDRLAERGLRSWRSNAAWLVLGQADEAEAQVDASLPARQPGEAFQLRHYYEMLARSQMDLYRDAGAAAHARVETAWRDLERSMMLRVETVRIESWYLRGRCALAAASAGGRDPSRLLRLAERGARVIEKTGAGAGAPLAASLRATVAHRRGQADAARAALDAALAGFVGADMSLFAAAAQHRLGELIGGDHGGRLTTAATAVMTAGRVADPVAMSRLLLPGW